MTKGGAHLQRFGVAIAAGIALSAVTAPVSAHCDTLDGPVVGAARKALDASSVNLILVGVHKKDDVAAGRAYASAYVEYVHYVERPYEAADTLAPGAERKSVEHVH